MTVEVSTLAVAVKSDGIKQTKEEMTGLNRTAGNLEKRVETLTGKLDKLSTAFQKGTASAMAYQAAVGNAVTRTFTGLAAAINGLNQGLAQNTTRTNTARREWDLFGNSMRDAHAAARGLSGSLGALWMTYGNLTPLAAGLAIGASLKGIITVGKDVEHTLEGIRVRGQESVQTVNEMRDAISSLGQGIYGPQEVAKAFETLVMAGLNAKQAMVGIKDAMNLAIVGGTSVEKSAHTLVQVATSLGYTAEGFGRVSDVIAKSAAVSMSSVESLSESFKSASAVGKLYGASLVDIGTGLAALSQLGISGSAAGTSLKNFYKELSVESDKLKRVLGAMKMQPSDLKDANGNFLDLVTLVGRLDEGLRKLEKPHQKLAMDMMANERGIKTLVEVLSLYRQKTAEGTSELENFRAKIEESYAFTALGAAQMALTMENQFKSIKNTLLTTFSDTFKEITPALTVLSYRLKDAFKSDEFKNAITGTATALTELAVVMVENASTVTALIAAILGFKAAGIVTSIISGIAASVTAATAAFTAGRTAAMAFHASLGLLGVVLGLGAAAWAFYHQHKAGDENKTKAGLENLETYIKSLTEENERMEKVNAQLAQGKTLRDAETTATQEQAIALAQTNKQLMLQEAIKKRQLAIDNIANANTPVERGAAERELAAAKSELATLEAKGESLVQQVKAEVERARANARVTAAYQEKLANERKNAGEGGTGVIPTKPDNAAVLNAYKSDLMALNRLAEGYDAKARKAVAAAETEVQAVADVERAKLESAINDGKYAGMTEKALNKLREAAERADIAKFNLEKQEAFGAVLAKTSKNLQVETAALEEANSGHAKLTNTYEAEAQAFLKRWNIDPNGELAKRYLAEAKALGETVAMKERLLKFNRATENLQTEAAGLVEAGDASMQYGKKGKQTALQLAELKIAQDGLSLTMNKGAVEARINAAALKDIGHAYNELAKMAVDIEDDNKEYSADLVGRILNDESLIVEARRQTALRSIEAYYQQGEAAYAAALKTGQVTKEQQDAYDKMVAARQRATDAVNQRASDGFLEAAVINAQNLTSEMETLAGTMEGTFGGAGAAIGGLVKGLAQMNEAQANYNQALAEANKLRQEGKFADAIKLETKAQKTQAQLTVKSYADMVGSAKKFFKEKTAGYKVLDAIEKGLHAWRMAAQIAEFMQSIGLISAETAAIVTGHQTQAASATSSATVETAAKMQVGVANAVAGISNQANGDPYTAFPRMAAMAAIMAALGLAVGGGFGGGGSSVPKEMTSEYRQKMQGTGSVLGDEEAKSESIANSLELLSSNSDIALEHSSKMLFTLRGIRDGIAGMSAFVARSTGLRGTTADERRLGVGVKKGAFGFSSSSTELTDTGIIFNKVMTEQDKANYEAAMTQFRERQKDSDGSMMLSALAPQQNATGLQTVGSVLNGGVSASGYADIHKEKKSWWGLSSSSSDKTILSNLDNDLLTQMTMTIGSLFDGVIQAASVFGKDAGALADMLNNISLQELGLDRISLKGLSGDEITKELEAVFGKAGDVMAQKAMPELKAFQKVGEGYFETLIKVANGIDVAKYTLEQLNVAAVDYTEITNKQGDVATEIARDSLIAIEKQRGGAQGIADIVRTLDGTIEDLADAYRELDTLRNNLSSRGLGTDGIGRSMIRGAGGLDNLTSGMDDFFSNFFTDAENNASSLMILKNEFRALGLEMPTTKEGFKTLLTELVNSGEEGAKTAGKLATLSGAVADFFDTAEDIAKGHLDTAMDMLQRAVEAEKDAATKAYEAEADRLKKKAEKDAEAQKKLLEPAKESLKAIEDIFKKLQDAIKSTKVESAALNAARRREAQATLAEALGFSNTGGDLTKFGGLDKALETISKPSEDLHSSFEDYARDQAITALTLESLAGSAKKQADKAQLTIDAINDTIEAIKESSERELEVLKKAHEDNIKRLDDILTWAQNEIDALNGINTSVLSVRDAVNNFTYALNAAKAATPGAAAPAAPTLTNGGSAGGLPAGFQSNGAYVDGGGLYYTPEHVAGNQAAAQHQGVISDLFLDLLGRSPDIGARDFYAGWTPSAIEQAIRNSDEFASLDVGTNYVPEDMFANIHEGERIIPKADNAELMRRLNGGADQELLDAIRDLKQTIMSGDVANVQQAREFVKLLRKWDGEGMPETRNVDA